MLSKDFGAENHSERSDEIQEMIDEAGKLGLDLDDLKDYDFQYEKIAQIIDNLSHHQRLP